MAKVSNNDITDMSQDWGQDTSNGLPFSGRAVQKFIKDTFKTKAGVFYYDTANNRYLVFADAETRDSYIENPSQTDLILGTFDAPFNYSAEINLTTPTYVAIAEGTVGNYIAFTFDTKNKQGNSVGEDVICTYTFIRGSVKKVVSQKYRYGTAVRFNIDEYLLDGTNTIIVGITGQTTLAATTVGITYQVINLKLEDSFDFAQVQNLMNAPNAVLEVPYTVSGTGTKTMEWYLDGEQLDFIKNEDEVVEVTSSRTKYISIAGLSQGRHNIQFRAYSVVNEERFYSATLYRDFMVYKVENFNEIIAVAAVLPIGQEIITDGNLVLQGAKQYIAYELKFATYNPSASTSKVEIKVNGNVVATMDSQNGVQNTYTLLFTDYGDKTIQIVTETSTYEIPINVSQSDTSLAEITEGLFLDLQAMGKSNSSDNKDSWEYGNYKTTFNGFSWNKISGWVNNRLLISDGASIEINVAPLSTDALSTGKTLEFEFATRNVSDDNAIVCDLRGSNGVGLLITASEVTLTSVGGAKLSTKYKSEENIRVSLVINRRIGTANKLLALIYINGVLSGAVNFSDTDNFLSNKNVEFSSSEDVEIELKQLRFYDEALNSDQILNNYILYRDTAEELIHLYDRNNIYGEDGYSFSPDILVGQLPVMIFTGNIPELENTTDKNKEIVVDVEYTNLQDPKKSFRMESAILRPQGTSSMSYPKKNFRLYTKRRDDTVLYDSDGRVVMDKLYAFKDGAQPVDCWCMKADYAESSGTHNTGIARLWNEVMTNARIDGEYVCRTEAQKKARENAYPYDVRTTVDGFPILIFYRLTSNDDLIFIGKYNFNNDKSTESVFGFEGIPGFDNSRMQCWEVLNNGHHLALFQDVNNFDTEWTEAFEARYPDVGEDADITDLKNFATWLVSTKDDLEKFKTEKWAHLDVYKVAAYYVYFMRFGAVDQTVKNAMFTSEDGEHFYYINYDNDTINGVRNDGLLIYPPTIDRQSLDDTFEATVYAYAGHDSTLWNNLEADDEFMQIVSEVDNALFSAGLTYANVIEMFDTNQCDMWNERVYNQDAQYKYIGPYTDSGINNLYMLQGKRQSHRRWWLSRRFNYLDSKFVSGDYKSNTFEIKMAGAPIGIEFSITAGFDMDFGYGVNNIPIDTGVSLQVGESHTFTTKQVLNIGDPLRIYSAVNLQEIDVHNFIEYLSTINMDKVYNEVLGTKLKKLVLGVDVSSDTRRNTSITEISGLGQAERIEYLDISGFKGITSLDLTPFRYLTTFKAKQSGLTSVDFAEGALLSRVELPDTLQSLRMNGLGITPTNLVIENTWASIRYLEVKNCTGFNTNFAWFQDWYKKKTAPNNTCTLIAEGIVWGGITCAELIELGQLKMEGGTLSLKGKIRLSDSSQEDVNTIREIFGANCFNPLNDLYISAPDAIYITGPTELKAGESGIYQAAVFSDNIGTVVYSMSGGSSSLHKLDENTGVLTTTRTKNTYNLTITATHTPTSGAITRASMTVRVVGLTGVSSRDTTISGPALVSSRGAFTANYKPDNIEVDFSAQWSLSNTELLEIESQEKGKCVVNVKKVPSEITNVELYLDVTDEFKSTFRITKTFQVFIEGVIFTSTTNPDLMRRCYNAGWCANKDYMTEDEAALVTNEMLGKNLQEIRDDDFSVFKYFIGITELDRGAFSKGSGSYSSFLVIEFPPNLRKLSLMGCRNLKEIVVPSSVESLQSYCFYQCSSLKKITFSNICRVKNDDTYSLFSYCSSLEEIVNIDFSGLTEIQNGAFEDCSKLVDMDFLKSILTDKITSIGSAAFAYCTGLTGTLDLTAHSGISLYSECFKGANLTAVILPDTVGSLSYSIFSGNKITEGNLPKVINSSSNDGTNLYGDTLQKLLVPKNINLTVSTFSSTGMLGSNRLFSNAAFEIALTGEEDEEATIVLEDGIVYDKDKTTIFFTNIVDDEKEVTFPATVSKIGSRAFYCVHIKSLKFEAAKVTGYFWSLTYSKVKNFEAKEFSFVSSRYERGFYGASIGTFRVEKLSKLVGLMFSSCTSLKTIEISKMAEAPKLDSSDNPFGSSTYSYTGRSTYNQNVNKLIVPENATGYDLGKWLDPLCNPEKCGFTLEKSLPAVEIPETVETLSAKNKVLTQQNRALMSFASMTINTMSLDTDAALDYKELYPKWDDVIGEKVGPKFRLREGEYPDDKLYEVIQEHTVSAEWLPSQTSSLYKVVSKDPDAGTITNPIEWSKGMELLEGKYYIDKGVKYLCIRNSGIPMSYDLADLVSGGFVKVEE